MLIILGGKKYILYWKHEQFAPSKKTPRAVTTCFVKDIETRDVLAMAATKCCNKDQFRKDIGRRLSLERVCIELHQSGIVTTDLRSFTKEVFKQYDARINIP